MSSPIFLFSSRFLNCPIVVVPPCVALVPASRPCPWACASFSPRPTRYDVLLVLAPLSGRVPSSLPSAAVGVGCSRLPPATRLLLAAPALPSVAVAARARLFMCAHHQLDCHLCPHLLHFITCSVSELPPSPPQFGQPGPAVHITASFPFPRSRRAVRSSPHAPPLPTLLPRCASSSASLAARSAPARCSRLSACFACASATAPPCSRRRCRCPSPAGSSPS